MEVQNPMNSSPHQETVSPTNDKLWLLSMTAEQAKPSTRAEEGYVSPPTPVIQLVETTHSPVSKSTDLAVKDMAQMQNPNNQTNNRKRPREYMSAGPLRISASLNPQQAEALAMALNACRIKLKSSRKSPTPILVNPVMVKEQKIEQQHVNQPKRRHGEAIDTLKNDIMRLKAYKEKVEHQRKMADPIWSIGDLYFSLGLDASQRQLPDVRIYQQRYGCTPGLQVLLDLQREEFDSVASMKFHWLWYRTQFRVFEFSMKSYERLEIGEHVIIKVIGELKLDVYSDARKRIGEGSGYGTVVCPVLQQFEFEAGEQVVRRITSEVDLVGGVVSIHGQSGPGSALSALQCLSEGFCISNRNQHSM